MTDIMFTTGRPVSEASVADLLAELRHMNDVDNFNGVDQILEPLGTKMAAMDAALRWILDQYMPRVGTGCDSRAVPDFAVAAAAGLSGIKVSK